MPTSIAFFGPVGTYTEEAALKYNSIKHNSAADLKPFPTIAGVVPAVSSGLTEEGVVPIENSVEGSVTYTLDLLISQSDLSICSEIVLPINHYLMAMPGTGMADIQVIYSHPQSLAQCRNYLERTLPRAQQIASSSNSAAVTDMKASSVPAAAIAPKRAAALYDVEIIEPGVQDSATNETRFVVLARQDHPRTGDDKTSMCFSFPADSPGALHGALAAFALRNINLAKIESRPTKESLGEYIFLVDCAGHRDDALVKEALEALAQQVSMLKVLGSYPRWKP